MLKMEWVHEVHEAGGGVVLFEAAVAEHHHNLRGDDEEFVEWARSAFVESKEVIGHDEFLSGDSFPDGQEHLHLGVVAHTLPVVI